MAIESFGCDAASGDEVAPAHTLGHDTMKLVGGIAIAEGDNDLIALIHLGLATSGELKPFMVPFAHQPGEAEIASPRRSAGSDPRHIVEIDPTRHKGALGATDPILRDAFRLIASFSRPDHFL